MATLASLTDVTCLAGLAGLDCLNCLTNLLSEGVKTGSPQALLGGPGGQGTRVEVSPDTSRA